MLFLINTLQNHPKKIFYTLLAGTCIGFGFCTSQKAVWYWFAIDCGLIVYWLMYQRRISDLLTICLFNLAAFAVLLLYISIFASVSSLNIVLSSMFAQAIAIYQVDWYEPSRLSFWAWSVKVNPLLFLLVPLGWLSLLVTSPYDQYRQRLFITVCTTVILFCLITYKQIFPYYMQAIAPAFLLFYAAIFNWILALRKDPKNDQLLLEPYLWLTLLALYSVFIIALVFALNLPLTYLLVCLIPLNLSLYLQSPLQKFTLNSLFLLPLIGAFIALLPLTQHIQNISGDYQKKHLIAMDEILQSNGGYFAGIDLLYNRSQPVPGLELLAGPTISYLTHPTEKLKEVMLPSLNLNGSLNIMSVLQTLQNAPVKLYVNNYRIHLLPAAIKQFLANQYLHYSGSLYLYAPLIAKQQNFILKFPGKYQVISAHAIYLQNQMLQNNNIVYLEAGSYRNINKARFRLKLIVANQSALPMNMKDDWEHLAQ